MIPVTEKDLPVLDLCIEGIRENINHKIDKIIIVSPYNDTIVEKSAQLKIEWQDEKQIVPPFLYDYPFKSHSKGWILQQLIKLSAEIISDKKYILICDADTVFIRPHCFKSNSKHFFYCHAGVHFSYNTLLKEVLKISLNPIISYIANFMLFDRTVLLEIKKNIEMNTGLNWIKSLLVYVDDQDKAKLSEFELYGNYCWSKYSRNIKRFYWFNIPLSRSKLEKYEILKEKYAKKYKSLSFHSYLN